MVKQIRAKMKYLAYFRSLMNAFLETIVNGNFISGENDLCDLKIAFDYRGTDLIILVSFSDLTYKISLLSSFLKARIPINSFFFFAI